MGLIHNSDLKYSYMQYFSTSSYFKPDPRKYHISINITLFTRYDFVTDIYINLLASFGTTVMTNIIIKIIFLQRWFFFSMPLVFLLVIGFFVLKRLEYIKFITQIKTFKRFEWCFVCKLDDILVPSVLCKFIEWIKTIEYIQLSTLGK